MSLSALISLIALFAGGCDSILGIREPTLLGDAAIPAVDQDGGDSGDAGQDAQGPSFEMIATDCSPDPVSDVALARSAPGSVQDRSIVALADGRVWICHDPLGGGSAEEHALDAQAVQAMWLGDLTGNGTDDVAVLTDSYMFFLHFDEEGSIGGDGMFGESIAGFNPGWMVSADLSGEGQLGLVVVKTHIVSLERDGETWYENYLSDLPPIIAAAFTSLGPSQAPDILTLSRAGSGGDPGDELLVWSPENDPPFYVSPTSYPIEEARDAIAVVSDPSGEVILVAVETNEGIAVLPRSSGAAELGPPEYVAVDFGGPVATGDVTGDGFTDVVGMRKSGANAALMIMESGEPEIIDLPLAGPVTAFAVADVDGDGLSDIIAAGHFGVVVLRQLPP